MRLRRKLSVNRVGESIRKLLRFGRGGPFLPAKFLQLCDRFGRITPIRKCWTTGLTTSRCPGRNANNP